LGSALRHEGRVVPWPDVPSTGDAASHMEEDDAGFTMGTARGGGPVAHGQLLPWHLRCGASRWTIGDVTWYKKRRCVHSRGW
jgi:hypothetical protein